VVRQLRAMTDRDLADVATDEDVAIPSLAMVAHEMRGPLGVIVTSLTQLGTELQIAGEVAPRVQMLLDRLQRNTALMARMTTDLLEIGRTHLGLGDLRKEVVDLVKVTEDITASLPESEMRRLTVRMPARAEIRCDRDRFAQIVSNLVRNGFEHSPGRVEVCIESARDGWALIVENDGDLVPAVRERLFQPFTRGNPGGHGLGLGLYLVRRLAEAHGGHAAVESPETGRIRFVVWLPRAE
jgi:signal transduction histidine kinase